MSALGLGAQFAAGLQGWREAGKDITAEQEAELRRQSARIQIEASREALLHSQNMNPNLLKEAEYTIAKQGRSDELAALRHPADVKSMPWVTNAEIQARTKAANDFKAGEKLRKQFGVTGTTEGNLYSVNPGGAPALLLGYESISEQGNLNRQARARAWAAQAQRQGAGKYGNLMRDYTHVLGKGVPPMPKSVNDYVVDRGDITKKLNGLNAKLRENPSEFTKQDQGKLDYINKQVNEYNSHIQNVERHKGLQNMAINGIERLMGLSGDGLTGQDYGSGAIQDYPDAYFPPAEDQGTPALTGGAPQVPTAPPSSVQSFMAGNPDLAAVVGPRKPVAATRPSAVLGNYRVPPPPQNNRVPPPPQHRRRDTSVSW